MSDEARFDQNDDIQVRASLGTRQTLPWPVESDSSPLLFAKLRVSRLPNWSVIAGYSAEWAFLFLNLFSYFSSFRTVAGSIGVFEEAGRERIVLRASFRWWLHLD